jgi:hypothetical protein
VLKDGIHSKVKIWWTNTSNLTFIRPSLVRVRRRREIVEMGRV